MVTKLATGVQAGEVPDVLSFDLIYMPDFMRAGFLTDLTADLKDDPNQAKVAQAYKDLATYDGKLYGTGWTPDVSILMWNKDLFKQAGPRSGQGADHACGDSRGRQEDHARSATTPTASISPAPARAATSSPRRPMMVASGAKLLPHDCDEEPLQGPGVKEVLQLYRDMWTEGLVPESAQADNGQNFVALF